MWNMLAMEAENVTLYTENVKGWTEDIYLVFIKSK